MLHLIFGEPLRCHFFLVTSNKQHKPFWFVRVYKGERVEHDALFGLFIFIIFEQSVASPCHLQGLCDLTTSDFNWMGLNCALKAGFPRTIQHSLSLSRDEFRPPSSLAGSMAGIRNAAGVQKLDSQA